MEYLEHGDLEQFLTQPLSEPETRQIAQQVVEGLRFMHEHSFVHRDLKPGVSCPVEPHCRAGCQHLS
jgi:serine/threonine protein kinase